MSDTATTEPPRPERELRKGDEDRVLAGVCAGLGRYTGIDPVVWRATFVLTAFAGATGLILYVAAWMLMRDPQGGPATFEQMLDRRIPPRAVPKLLAVGLAVATAFSLVGGLQWSTLVLAVPLVLGLLTARSRGVDLRAAFVRLREDLRSKEPPPATPSPEPTPAYYNPAQPWASSPHGPVDLAVISERSSEVVEEEGPEGGEGGPDDHVSPKRDAACRKGAPLASLALWTIVAGAVVFGVASFGWSSSLWSTQMVTLLFGPGTGVFFLAGALAVVGLYSVVGTWAGNPRGLMALGLSTALVLVLTSVTDLTQVRIGGQTWRPATVAEAEEEHLLTIGSGTMDLPGLEDLAPGETVDVSLRVGAGVTELILPEDARVAVESRVDLGVVTFGGSEVADGMAGFSLSYEEVHEPVADDATDPPVINVRTDSLVGVVEVRHGEA